MSDKRVKQRTILISAAIALVVVAGGVAWWANRPARPTRAQVVVTAAAKSGDFDSVKRAVDAGEVNVADVRTAVRSEFERQTLERVDNYFGTTDPAARRAVLDRAIDDLERFRAEARKRPPSSQPTSPADDPRLAMAAWAMSQPPNVRARLAEFRVAIEKRRSERGLTGLFDGGKTLPLGKS